MSHDVYILIGLIASFLIEVEIFMLTISISDRYDIPWPIPFIILWVVLLLLNLLMVFLC